MRRETQGSPEAERPLERRKLPGEELALIVLSILILVIPAIARDRERVVPILDTLDLEPLRIDVHEARWYEWALLDGIGEARARRIVEFVERNRPIESLDELAEIPGLPSTWLEKARPSLHLERPEVSTP